MARRRLLQLMASAPLALGSSRLSAAPAASGFADHLADRFAAQQLGPEARPSAAWRKGFFGGHRHSHR